MITKQIGEDTLELYDDIEEIPEIRREKLDTYQILGSELNPRHDSFQGKINSIVEFIYNDKKEDAENALYNFQRAIKLCANGNNLNRISYGCLVKTINGEPNDDLSDEVLDAKIRGIKELTTHEIEETILSVKKNY